MTQYFLEIVEGLIVDVMSTDTFAPLPVYDDPEAEEPEIVDFRRHPAIPTDAPEVDEETAFAIRSGGRWRWDGTRPVREAEPEPDVPPAPPISLSPATFFGRMSDEEAEAIDTAMRAKPIRIRSIWASVADQGRDLVEDTTLWPALREEIVKLYGQEKATDLLAAPNGDSTPPA